MKSRKISKAITMMLGLTLAVGAVFMCKVDVKAAHQISETVQGTVCKGTTADTLYLYNPSKGKYTIKIDSDTNTSACRVLSVGKTVTVALYKGSDSAMHADSIASGNKTPGVSIDTSSKSTVTGTVGDATTDDMLVLKTSSGDMQIKIEPTTDMSGCNILVAGKTVTVVCSRGSDAFNHALSINSGTTATATTSQASTSSSTSTSQTSEAPANTIAVTGTPSDKSKPGELYLQTKDGTYYLVVDSGADTSSGFMFTSGNSVTAYIYRGSDANMHTNKVVGKRSSGGTVGSSQTTFTGTVSSKSKEEMLYLSTSGGTMEFKLDPSTSLSGAKGLVSGANVSVSGSVGSDGYWHAVSITANAK